MKLIQIVNKYEGENCYLRIQNSGAAFHLCDIHNEHIDGYYLFGIFYNGLVRDEGIAEDISIIPNIDTDEDNNYTLLITGVDII